MDNSAEILITNLVLPIIKDLVSPKIKSIIKKFSINDIDENKIESNFKECLSQRYEKYLIMDTLVFPNKQTLFNFLYEPLTIIAHTHKGKEIEIKIENYPETFLPKFIRAIIEDTAGMGKSTITKKLFLSIIEQNAGIPILIELRQINEKNDFLNEIQSQLSTIGSLIDIDFILQLLKEGQFIFLFDGFDEIAQEDRGFVIKDMHRFIEKANNNYFLITSRPEGSLVSFGDFQKFSVKPLIKEEANSLIKRYDYYSYKPIAEELLKQLIRIEDKTLNEYLTNPFLVSLLYKSFEYKKDIPIKKCQFYRQVYDALFEAHDLSKEGYYKRDKFSNLHLDDFERVLRYIGYLTSVANKVEYDKNYILNVIDKVKKHVPDLNFKSSDFLKDLLETVPLFKKDGNYIKWAHKSLQDYFAAKFIWIDARNEQHTILKKIYDDEKNRRFYNVLDLFYELDSNTFESTILLWLLEDFQKYCSENYNDINFVSGTLVKQRIENSFHKECVLVVSKKEDYDNICGGNRKGQFVIDYYFKKLNDVNNKFTHTTYNYFKKPKIVVMTFIHVDTNIDTILQLISARIPNLASYKSHKVHLNELKLLKEDQTYCVDDQIDNIINNKSIFGVVNDLILSDYTINYDNSVKKLQQIKKSKNQQYESDLTSW